MNQFDPLVRIGFERSDHGCYGTGSSSSSSNTIQHNTIQYSYLSFGVLIDEKKKYTP